MQQINYYGYRCSGDRGLAAPRYGGKHLRFSSCVALPGPACRDGPPGAPFSSGPPLSSPPADAPQAAGGCPHLSPAGAPHLENGYRGLSLTSF